MKSRMFLFIISGLILLATPLFCDDLNAEIQEISGKVEIKKSGGDWSPVSVGDTLSAGDSISTGFNSKAVMQLGDTSILVAKDLTRLTLSELYDKEGTVVTDLFLDVGNIRSEVHSSEQVSNDFTIRNSNSTASVRGTVIDVEILGDGRGMKVMAWDGMGEVTNLRTGRVARVGERKEKKKDSKGDKEEENKDEEESDDGSSDADSESDSGSGSEGDSGSGEMAPPSEPPAEIAAAPVMASSSGGMVSSMSSAIASTTVTVSTKPPAPTAVSTGGGGSSSTETTTAVAEVVEEITGGTTEVPTTTTVNIQVVWPE